MGLDHFPQCGVQPLALLVEDQGVGIAGREGGREARRKGEGGVKEGGGRREGGKEGGRGVGI